MMTLVPRSAIIVTRSNARHLRVLARMAIAEELGRELVTLYEKLDSAILVDDEKVPRGVVTLGSSVVYYDPRSETEHGVVLTFPWNAAPAVGRVSVASPLGVALLGSRIGMTLRYRATLGSPVMSRIDVLDVPYQPEWYSPS